MSSFQESTLSKLLNSPLAVNFQVENVEKDNFSNDGEEQAPNLALDLNKAKSTMVKSVFEHSATPSEFNDQMRL